MIVVGLNSLWHAWYYRHTFLSAGGHCRYAIPVPEF